MAKPAIPTVAPELWLALLNQLVVFRKAEPWRWMPDSAVSAYVDASGQPWFACILGNAGQVFGLCLYRGASGLSFHRKVQELGNDFDPAEHQHEHDALTVWFGPKSDLTREQRALYERLGFAPKQRGRLGWPDVRNHRPGWFPWYPEENEVRVLLEAIPGILAFADLYRRHPDCYEGHGVWDLPTLPPSGSPLEIENLEWRTWLNPPQEEIGPPVPVDMGSPRFRNAAVLPQANETIEFDWFYMPEAVAGGGRPFYARCMATFRGNGGYCFGMELLEPEDDAATRASAMVLQAIERLGARPTQILTTRDDLAARLRPLAASLGAESKAVRHLTSIREFRAGLEAHMAAGTSRRST